jgi:DNA-directed RNA polymerase subunit RPC12/RpoP
MVIIVNYDPWYFISIESGFVKPIVYGCEPTSNGAWCRNGSEITVEMPTKSMGFLIVNEFDGWSLNGESFTSAGAVSMRVDRPLTLTAIWRTNYTGLIVLVASIGSVIFVIGFVNIKGQTLYKRMEGLVFFLIRGRAKIRPIDYITYTVCSNCNSVPPQDFKGDTCPNCNHKIVTKLIPTRCPKCHNELGTIAFPPPLEIRCRECGYIIQINKEH